MSAQLWKKPLILAASLFVLGTFVYWLEYSHAPKQEERKDAERKILNLKGTQIASIRVIDGKKAYAFRCLDLETKLCKPGDNSKWEITEPSRLKADDSNVNSLVSSINNLTPNETIDLKGETPKKKERLFKEYKLDEASRKDGRRVEVVTSSGDRFTLFLGDTHPIGDTQFIGFGSGKSDTVALDETRVMLVPTYFKNNVEHGMTHWRDKKVLSLNAHQVRSFVLEGTKAKIQAERKEGGWSIKSLKGAASELSGDIENIDNLLNAAAFMAAKDFSFEDKADSKARTFVGRLKKLITLTMKVEGSALNPKPTASGSPVPSAAAPEMVVITVYQKGSPARPDKKGKSKPASADYKLFAIASPHSPVYEVDTSISDRMDKEIKDLRLTKLVTSMDRFAAKKIRFEGKSLGVGALELQENQGKWMISPENRESDPDKVQAFLDKVSGNRIIDFIDAAKAPAGEADGMTVSIGDAAKPEKRKIIFWEKTGKLYGRDLLSNRKEVYAIDSSLKDALPTGRGFFDKPVPVPGASAKPGAPKKPLAPAAGHDHNHDH